MWNHIKQQLKEHSSEHADHKTQVEALGAMVDGLSVKKCQFCGGWGHYAPACATKKTMDASVKGIPIMKAVWGTIKGVRKEIRGKRKALTTIYELEDKALHREIKRLRHETEHNIVTDMINTGI